jgi:hypothetical protein
LRSLVRPMTFVAGCELLQDSAQVAVARAQLASLGNAMSKQTSDHMPEQLINAALNPNQALGIGWEYPEVLAHWNNDVD